MTENEQKRRPARWFFILGIAVVIVAAAAVLQLLARQSTSVAAETALRARDAESGPRVEVVLARKVQAPDMLTLLGEARPYQATTVYAKVSGYLRTLDVDKGDHVRANQALAVIESPELDKQYEAAVADAKNKELNAQRAATLVKKEMISQQDADQAETDAQVARANLQQLETMKSYEVLRAPFAGTVTARFADPGALIQNAANAQTSAQPVVSIAQTGRLRVYVYVDQAHAAFVHEWNPATVLDPARPGLKVKAHVTRTSGQIDEKTRTLLAEIDIDNPRDRILAGSFVQVQLQAHTPDYIELPSDALIVHGDQTMVAVVGEGDKVRLRPVLVADQTGDKVRVVSGVTEGERVARNLGDRVGDGRVVQPVTASGS